MISLYHYGIISPLPIDQLESYMTQYGFRIKEHHDEIWIIERDPIPLVFIEGPSHDRLQWNLDHYPLTQEGTQQLEKDLSLWQVSDHNRMVLLLTHQERYQSTWVGYIWAPSDTVSHVLTLRVTLTTPLLV